MRRLNRLNQKQDASNLMNTLFNIFRSRWFISLIGVIALSVLVWFIGPLVAVAEVKPLEALSARVVLVILLFCFWAFFNYISVLKHQKANKKLITNLDASASQDFLVNATEAEASILQERFAKAMTVLRKTSGQTGFSKKYLYDLPWYIIIGPPGSGKTTALKNSGLDFPLAHEIGADAVKGLGGTRNCDWWFTNQAVLIDTAGRYTTQDSHADVDKTAWFDFLALLKKSRPRQPINGAMIAISAVDILTKTEHERREHVNAIRLRLQELNQKLGIKTPVYFMLTKCDMLAGFNEFFDELTTDERAQVWGMTFTHGQGRPDQLFNEEFQALIAKLSERTVTRMHFERDTGRRAQILGFPQQVAMLQNGLSAFVEEIFGETRFLEQANLRGVYLTSGTQEGTPIDRVLSAYTKSLDIPQHSLRQGPGKSYFLEDLLKKVIFSESDLVGVDFKAQQSRVWFQRLGYVGAFAVTIASILIWSTSFSYNQLSLKNIDADIYHYQEKLRELSRDSNEYEVAKVIALLKPVMHEFESGRHFYNTSGLYQGSDIQPLTEKAYRTQLIDVFLPAMKQRLAYQVEDNFRNPEYLFQALKAYLMLNKLEKLDTKFLAQWMSIDWSLQYKGQADKQQLLNETLQQLLVDSLPVSEINMSLVTQARKQLLALPLDKQVYIQIKSNYERDQYKDFNFNAALGQEFSQVFEGGEYSFPNLYTYNGYYKIFRKELAVAIQSLADDHWVLGQGNFNFSKHDLASLSDKTKSLYFQDYVKHWNKALFDLRLKPVDSLDKAVEQLGYLTGNYSAIEGVLNLIKENTELGKLPVDLQQLAGDHIDTLKDSAKLASSKLSRVANLADKAAQKGVQHLPQDEITIVDKRFEELNLLATTSQNRPAPIVKTLQLLYETQTYIDDKVQADTTGEAIYKVLKQKLEGANSDPLSQLRLHVSRQPQPLKGWVEGILDQNWAMFTDKGRGYINMMYDLTVYQPYKQRVSGRYPLVDDSTHEMTMQDFSSFYGKDGVMELFFKDYLEPFVETRTRPWNLRSIEGHTIGLYAESLRQFELAAYIFKVFFQSGKQQPDVSFSMRPIYLDATISRFEMQMLGQKLSYRHGPQAYTKLSWPFSDNVNTIKWSFEDVNGARVTKSIEGSWALFKLMHTFPLERTAVSDRYKLTLNIDNKKIVYEVYASQADNPFSADILSKVNLPAEL